MRVGREEGREGGRDGGREERREGGMEEGKEGGREGGREGGTEGRREEGIGGRDKGRGRSCEVQLLDMHIRIVQLQLHAEVRVLICVRMGLICVRMGLTHHLGAVESNLSNVHPLCLFQVGEWSVHNVHIVSLAACDVIQSVRSGHYLEPLAGRYN